MGANGFLLKPNHLTIVELLHHARGKRGRGPWQGEKMSIRVGVLTVTDRSARGNEPTFGPTDHHPGSRTRLAPVRSATVPDEFEQIKKPAGLGAPAARKTLSSPPVATVCPARRDSEPPRQCFTMAPGIGELMPSQLKVTP